MRLKHVKESLQQKNTLKFLILFGGNKSFLLQAAGEWTKENVPDSEISYPLEIGADGEIQRQLPAMRRKQNTSVWANIAAKLNDSGCKGAASQYTTRIHSVEHKYKEAKNRNNTLGQGRNICPFFEEVDAVLGTKPSIAAKLILKVITVASGECSHCLDCEALKDVCITDTSAKAQKAALLQQIYRAERGLVQC